MGRIASLDVLRGLGVLGMLAAHIQLFAYPSLARWNPTAYGDLSGLNWWVWLVNSILADGKFISIFAMLVGASILMMAGQSDERPVPAWRTHARRMTALLLLGLTHAYLLWYGDMLVALGLCGAVVFFARGLSPRPLLVLGSLVFATATALSLALTWSTAQSDPVGLFLWNEQWTPRPEVIALEIAQYRGGWMEQMVHRVPAAWESQTWSFATRVFWQTAGLMLFGMALFKLGVLTGRRSPAFYIRMAFIGFGVGGLLIALALWRSFATQWDLLDYVLVSQELKYWGNLFVALGWIAVVMLVCQRNWPVRLLAGVGRMALSNYLLQTLICITIFYGHGLGLFGQIDRVAQFAIVIGIWAFQLAASSAWLTYFASGPVEWATRWFVFGRRPRFLRSAPGSAIVT
jgi:uncharacterized protein